MRQALQRTWYPFFARFPRPTAIQLAAWRPLLAGRDCLVMSPTASGKTEAVMAPLIERHLPSGDDGAIRILVVCPTRALVNDLVRRTTEPLTRAGVRVHRRTGDQATLDRKRPPGVLITTPESLDSLLCRHTGALRGVRAVVLDELHIIDGGPRGDALRVELWRLRRLLERRGHNLQVVASSATMHEPEALAARYLVEAVQVERPGQRPIDAQWVGVDMLTDIVADIRQRFGQAARKILVFAERRADVELLASVAARSGVFNDRVYAHHGSLSRAERERVESRFLGDPSAICFATMTLELGIDIGDVDLVALTGPPSSVSAFLQRVGRGNRRTEKTRVVGYYRNEGDLARFRHIIALARRGELCEPRYAFRPSVLVQQTGSLIYQSRGGWISPKVLQDRLPPELRSRYNETRIRDLFAELVKKDWLTSLRPGRWGPGQRLALAFDLGTIHGNIEDTPDGTDVIDETTGHSLGKIQLDGSERSLAIAGRGHEIRRRASGRVYVVGTQQIGEAVKFSGRGIPHLSAEMARSLAESLGVPDGAMPLVPGGRGVALFHFMGSLAGFVLARYLKASQRWKAKALGGLAIGLEEMPAVDVPPPTTADALRNASTGGAGKLARLAQAGPYHSMLPTGWQLDFLQEAVSFDQVAARWSASHFLKDPPDSLAEVLLWLSTVK